MVPLYSTIVGPLQKLVTLKKWEADSWGEQHDKALENLQKALLAAPVITAPDLNRPFHISTDASQHGVGGVLYQIVGGERKYVAFCSKSLKKGQRHYSATKRELLAIIFCLKRWDPFLQGQHFTVETDHKALTYMHSAKSHMLLDWARFLSSYNFTVKHIPGPSNILPHYLLHLDGILDDEEDGWPEEAIIATSELVRRSGRQAQLHQEGVYDASELSRDATMEVDDNPAWHLRNTEKMFAEKMLECEWVEDYDTRDNLVKAAHDD